MLHIKFNKCIIYTIKEKGMKNMKKTRAICLVMAAALSLTLVGATDAMAAKKSKSTKIALSKKSA